MNQSKFQVALETQVEVSKCSISLSAPSVPLLLTCPPLYSSIPELILYNDESGAPLEPPALSLLLKLVSYGLNQHLLLFLPHGLKLSFIPL